MQNYEKKYKYKPLNPLALARSNEPTDYRVYCLSSEFAGYVRQFLGRMVDNPYWFYSAILPSGDYVTPNAQDFDIVSATIAEGIGELMAGCNLEDKFDQLILAVQGLSACCSVAGVGSQYAGPTAQAPSEFVDTGSNYPDGYEDRTDFDERRCNMANQIVADIVADVSFLSTVDALTATALGLAVGFVTPIPGDGLVYALILLTASLTVATIFFADVLNVLSSEGDALVCALYTADDVQSAKDAFISTVALSPYWGSQVFNGMFQSALPMWLNWTNLNRLFDGSVATITDGDCSGCFGECGDSGTWQHFPIFSSFGDGSVGTSGDDLTIVADSVYGPDGYRYSAFFGGDYLSPPLAARRLVNIATDNTLLDGETTLGYIQLFGPSFSDILGTISYSELASVNAMLAASNTCVAVVALAYAKQVTTLTLTFE